MSDWSVRVWGASGEERASLLGETEDKPLHTDVAAVVAISNRIIGWGDDYGTFHPLEEWAGDSEVREAAERMLQAANDLTCL